MGCDSSLRSSHLLNDVFQSTHPSWGATVAEAVPDNLVAISIHAPIVGCDTIIYFIHFLKYKFQSTHPSWGATKRYPFFKVWCSISIHAPIVGCDGFKIYTFKTTIHFNPRTHRGVRHISNVYWSMSWIEYFNPRTHRGVRQ